MKMLSMSTTADGQLHQPSDRKGIFGTDGWTDKLMNKWTENGKKIMGKMTCSPIPNK